MLHDAIVIVSCDHCGDKIDIIPAYVHVADESEWIIDEDKHMCLECGNEFENIEDEEDDEHKAI